MKIMTDFLPSKKDLLNAMAAIAAPVNKAIKKRTGKSHGYCRLALGCNSR